MQNWNFINSNARSPAYNMALDELLMSWQKERDFLPTLRFYFWDVPTLTIGHFQNAKKDINFEKVKEHGVEFVRRQTGGKAVLHDNELTYSVTLPENYPNMPKDVVSAYRVLTQGLIEGYREIGLYPKFSIPSDEKQEKTAVCFDTPSMYEVVIDNKKIAGSAQVRKNDMILQHGSVPLSINIDMLYDMFLFKSDRLKERLKSDFVKKASGIKNFLNKELELQDLIEPFKKGFAKGLNISLTNYTLSEKEEQEVKELAKNKYESDNWNLNIPKI